MYKILLVEDDPIIAQSIQNILATWHYEVILVQEFDKVLDLYLQTSPQLVILDITLPLFNGYYWCQEIRKVSNVPILFLSSHDQATEIVMSINMGADDYITKPFDSMVLVAKIQGLMRRAYELTAETEFSEYHGAMLNLKTTQLHYQGNLVDLTKNEFQILRVLFASAGHYVSRDQLMQELWSSEVFIDDNTLSVNMARLRKKLEGVGIEDFIHTKKGIGYGLVTAHEA